MRILVTGGAGYIGSNTIIDILESSNHEVVSIDNFSNSDLATFSRIEQITGKSVTNYNIDLTDYQSLVSNFFEKEQHIDGIIHFAALKAVGESVEKPLLYYQNNLNGLVNLLKCAQKFDVKYFIFSSSCTVYGNAAHQPVTENTPTAMPESPYGYTKLVGENIIRHFANAERGFKAISLRYFNPVGAHSSGLNGELPKGKPNNLVPIITQFLSGWLDELSVYGIDYGTRDGSAMRDYIHVSDIAHAHLIAMESLVNNENKPIYDIYNLGTGNGTTVFEVINAFERANSLKVNYKIGDRRKGDVDTIFADISKAKTELNWKPIRSLEESMRSAWQWQLFLNKTRNGDKAHRVEL